MLGKGIIVENGLAASEEAIFGNIKRIDKYRDHARQTRTKPPAKASFHESEKASSFTKTS
jgi:hypothetical protein